MSVDTCVWLVLQNAQRSTFTFLPPPHIQKREEVPIPQKYSIPQYCKLYENMQLNLPLFYIFTSSHLISMLFLV